MKKMLTLVLCLAILLSLAVGAVPAAKADHSEQVKLTIQEILSSFNTFSGKNALLYHYPSDTCVTSSGSVQLQPQELQALLTGHAKTDTQGQITLDGVHYLAMCAYSEMLDCSFVQLIPARQISSVPNILLDSTRFSKFFNLPELMSMFKEVADIKTADQLNLPTPTPHYETVVVQPTEIQKAMVQSLSERAGKVHSLRRFPTGSEMHASFS